jgi:uncharacterized protein YndB with AHSA1/START domain
MELLPTPKVGDRVVYVKGTVSWAGTVKEVQPPNLVKVQWDDGLEQDQWRAIKQIRCYEIGRTL